MRRNGERVWVAWTNKAIRDGNGKVIEILCIGNDITERRRLEILLSESEERYRRLFETASDAIVLLEKSEGNITHANPATEKMLGYSLKESIGKKLQDIGVLLDMSDFQTTMQNLNVNGIINYNDVPIKTKSGQYIDTDIYLVDRARLAQCNIRDVSERKRAEEERAQSFERMRKALRATVQAISITVEMKDPYTSGHQRRVADLARAIAAEMGLSADRQDFIHTVSSIHDIGKIAIPTEILSKPTKLIDLEFNLIKTHSQSGYDILKDIEFPWPVADVVLQHHERMNGSGYPQGLKGDNILLEARILAIADVVEAIAFHRPYRPAIGINLALEEISRHKGTLYDANVVDACLKLFREKSYQLSSHVDANPIKEHVYKW
jgi:PAS domain S-box-containing protein